VTGTNVIASYVRLHEQVMGKATNRRLRGLSMWSASQDSVRDAESGPEQSAYVCGERGLGGVPGLGVVVAVIVSGGLIHRSTSLVVSPYSY